MTRLIQLAWVANVLNVNTDRLSWSGEDIHIDHRFRVGYAAGLTFFRENPIPRSYFTHDVDEECDIPAEGSVDKNHEPQYDLRITFDLNGDVKFVSDQRTAQEADYLKHHVYENNHTPEKLIPIPCKKGTEILK